MSINTPRRYRVEIRPDSKYNTVLYMARRYRGIHDGPFTESFRNRIVWEKREFAEKKIVAEQERGFNRVWGHLTYSVVEETEDESRDIPIALKAGRAGVDVRQVRLLPTDRRRPAGRRGQDPE